MYPTIKGGITHKVVIQQPVLHSSSSLADATTPLVDVAPHKDEHVGWGTPEFVVREDTLVYTLSLTYPTYANSAQVTHITNLEEYIDAGRSAAYSSSTIYVVGIHILLGLMCIVLM